MSTSPSWFDQEKFSRLVKKVGPKTAPEPVTPPTPAGTGAHPEGMASTARISLVSKPPSLLSEHRALPALPRRTAPLPGLKSLFQAPSAKADQSPEPEPPAIQESHPEPIRVENLAKPLDEAKPQDEAKLQEDAKPEDDANAVQTPVEESYAPVDFNAMAAAAGDDENMVAIWHKMSLLNEELAQTIRERDQAFHDSELLREQLRQSDESLAGKESDATKEEFARLVRERDDALAEAAGLKLKLQLASAPASATPSFGKPQDDISQTKELSMLTIERDQARKQYADLRKEFEALKQTGGSSTQSLPAKEDAAKFRKELEKQLDGFRQQIEDKDKEIAELKAAAATAAPSSAPGSGGGDDAAKAEIATLREQLAKAKDEASVAQRGLALSQKALHETRDTLREATEGSSLSRHNFDNLKTECAALAQQNTVLQAQNDQLSRELAAAKSKLTTRT